MDIWLSIIEISGCIVLGVFSIYMLEVGKKWLFSKLV